MMIEIAIGVLLSIVIQVLIGGIQWGKFSEKIETMPHLIVSDMKLYVQKEISEHFDRRVAPELKELRDKVEGTK